jgi:PKD repeat protein
MRVSRFKLKATDPTVGDPASEVVILGKVSTAGCSGINQDCIPDNVPEHTIDTLQFFGGKLFVSVGDGASDAVTQSAFRAQNLDSLNGKILRINTDGTAPADNPFYNGNPSANRSKIYDYGLRNPFRFTIHPATGNLYIGDVGQSSWEEINTGRGRNFGWPCYEGTGTESQYIGDFKCQAVSASAVTKPIKSYPHTEGACIIGGPRYTGAAFPSTYQGSVFYADFVSGFIKRITLDASGNVTATRAFESGVKQPVFLTQGPDGNLYYISIGAQQLRRIRYVGSGNHPPVAQASATPTNGYPPLTVNFSSTGTSDADGNPLTYTWNFGDGGTLAMANPTHQYTAKGKFNAVLTVKDSKGATDTASVLITAGSKPPTATINQPANGIHVNVGTVVNFSGTATDPDEGTLTGAKLQWDVILHHNTHIHDGVVTTTGCCGSFTVQEHDTTATFYYEVKLTAVDSTGLTGTKSVFVYPNLPTSTCSVASATSVAICAPANGATVTSPFHAQAVGGSSVTFMELWLDSTKAFQTSGRSIDTTVTASAGTHIITVYGRNNTGVLDHKAVTISVGSGGSTCAVPGSAGVNVCSPADGSTSSSPVRAVASGTTTGTFARMELWVDGAQKFVTTSRTLNTTVSVGSGKHRFAFLAVNTAGTVINKAVNVNVP